ncbi:MAG: membrane protein insertase YidC, partial [Bacteroidota bacterium]
MDKNTVIGLLLIGGLLIGLSIYNSPSKEQLALQKRYRDSIELVSNASQKANAQQVIANEVIKQQAAYSDSTQT